MGLDQYFFRGSDKPLLHDDREEGGKVANYIQYFRGNKVVLHAINLVIGGIPRMQDASVWARVSDADLVKVIEVLQIVEPEATYPVDELREMINTYDQAEYLYHANW
jgi:hypothetical protein